MKYKILYCWNILNKTKFNVSGYLANVEFTKTFIIVGNIDAIQKLEILQWICIRTVWLVERNSCYILGKVLSHCENTGELINCFCET